MIKKNFAPWHINRSEFSEEWPDMRKLKFFARYAILAPSGHNTQPWHFNFDKNKLLINNNPARHLPYSGTQAAEPHISLGTCLETLVLAAKGFGYGLKITYELKGNLAVSVSLGAKEKPDSSLLDSIIHRTSNRHPYDPVGADIKTLQKIINTDLSDVSSKIISDKDEIAFIAEQTSHATHAIMGDPLFRLELSKWVRNNVTRQHDGMPGYVQGIPTPPSLVAKHIIKRIDVSKDQAKKDSRRVLQSPNLILISIKDQTERAFLNAGRLYAHICILAKQRGLDTSGIGAAVIDPDTKKAIKSHFGLKDQPVAIIRIGKAKKYARHTPRWPLHKVSD